ncbi:MAG: hypothetical protein RLZZ427_292, partial [Pseudomonadota bacterium]
FSFDRGIDLRLFFIVHGIKKPGLSDQLAQRLGGEIHHGD